MSKIEKGLLSIKKSPEQPPPEKPTTPKNPDSEELASRNLEMEIEAAKKRDDAEIAEIQASLQQGQTIGVAAVNEVNEKKEDGIENIPEKVGDFSVKEDKVAKFTEILNSFSSQIESLVEITNKNFSEAGKGPNLPNNSSEIKATLNDIKHKDEGLKSLKKQYWKILQDTIQQIELFKLTTPSDLPQLMSLVTTAKDVVISVRKNESEIKSGVDFFNVAQKKFVVAMIKEAGFDPKDTLAIEHQHSKLLETIDYYENRYILGMGKVFFKKKLSSLRQEEIRFEKIRSLRYQTDKTYYNPNKIELESIEGTIIDNLLRKIRDFSDIAVAELSKSEQGSAQEISPVLIGELNDVYIDKVARKDMAEQIRYSKKYGRVGKDFGTKEQREQSLVFLKEAFDVEMRPRSWNEPEEERDKREKVKDFLQKIPYQLGNFIERKLYGYGNRPNDTWVGFDKGLKGVKIEQYLHQLRGILETIRKKCFETQNYRVNRAGRDTSDYDFPILRNPEKFNENNAINFDTVRWSIFRSNKEVEGVYGKEALGQYQKVVEDHILDTLLEAKGDDNDYTLATRLIELRLLKSTPAILLDAFRVGGDGGGHHLIDADVMGHSGPEQTYLYKYISSLSEAEMESLKKMNVPGLAETVELIRNNKNNFCLQQVNTAEGKNKYEWVDNPVYKEIEAELGRMSCFLLNNGDESDKFFVLRTLNSTQVNLGTEEIKLLEQFAQSPKNVSEPIRLLTIKILVDRVTSYSGDGLAMGIILRNYSSFESQLGQDQKKEVKRGVLKTVFLMLSKNDEQVLNYASLAAPIIEKTANEIRSLYNFYKRLNNSTSSYSESQEDIKNIFDLANQTDTQELIIDLSARGYNLRGTEVPLLISLAPERAKIIAEIDEIRMIEPGFIYSPVKTYNIRKEVISDPYGIFADGILNRGKPEEKITEILKTANEKMKERFSRALFLGLRRTDPSLKNIPDLPETSDLKIKTFREAFERLKSESERPGSGVGKNKDFFFNKHSLYYLSRQPERIDEILEIPNRTPRLLQELLALGGPLYTNRDRVMEDIWSNGNALRRAEEIETIFEKKLPYWRFLYLFTRSRLGDRLSGATTEYPIEIIGLVNLSQLVKRHKEKKARNPDAISRLEALITDHNILAELVDGKIDKVPFRSLSGPAKHLVFRDRLRKTVELSRDLEAKTVADNRNREEVIEPLHFNSGTYIHGSSVDFARQMFLNGNLPGEALGESARADSYPFQVDFSCLTEDYLKTNQTVKDSMEKSISGGYGGAGKYGGNGRIIYVYDRSQTAWDPGVEYNTGNKNHTLVLGGMPATEITSIVLRSPDSTLNQMKKLVLENGFYVPLYDFDGKLLFTPAEFDELSKDFNISAPVEVFDNSFKTGEQRGSNAGGEYTVPTEKGPIKYYVKFEKPEGADHLWNEQLADNIYRTMDISVPNTRVVVVDGSIGHASQIIKGREATQTEFPKLLKGGFVADCLLANWDIPAKTDNSLVGDDGKLLRIDNGGSLLFRAQGTRKEGFGEVVLELETMRSGYEGVTKKEITEQIENLKRKLTNEVIDELVDGVRLRKNDRDYLKSVLRKRRDYIIEYYGREEKGKNKEISEKGKMLETLLKESEIDDKRLSVVVKEWERVSGQEGYQHNQVSLGEHIKEAVKYLSSLAEFKELNENEQNIALVAMLFHDIAKPTGKKGTNIPRDFSHEVPSAAIAAQYMREWGYSMADIAIVAKIITNDGVASDMARNKVRDQAKKMSPTEFNKQLGSKVLRILKLVNKADVVATVGENGFKLIEKEYNKYF